MKSRATSAPQALRGGRGRSILYGSTREIFLEAGMRLSSGMETRCIG